MNTTKLLPLTLLALLAAACTTPEKQAATTAPPTTTVAPPAATTAATIPVTDEAVPPLFVKVKGPASLAVDSDVEIDVEIVRTAPDSAPMQLMISVPSGAQLVKGLATESIVDTTSTSVHRVLTVHVGGTMPSADVVVTVDSSGPGMGVHATNAYRFGRPEPKLAQPVPGNGPSLSAKGVKLGKPIKAD
ncbi:MAG: hypothetical protein ABI175_09640 [Polyangiales bacterium]